MTQITEEQITAYLLGELPEPEAERVEEAVFNADAGELDAAAVEDDLIEAYLYGELPAPRRKRFEDNYLCTEARRQRVAFAAAEKKLIPSPPIPSPEPAPAKNWISRLLEAFKVRPLAFRLAVAAIVLVIAAPAIWMVGFRERAPQSFADLTLARTVDDTRGDPSAPPDRFDRSKEALRVKLPLPPGESAGASYQLDLWDEHGKSTALKIDSQETGFVHATILSSRLRPGNYYITLSRSAGDGSFVPLNGTYRLVVD
jgi:hypothetical protein